MSKQKQLRWIKVPKRYRVTRAEEYWYDLESTLPLALEFRRITNLGPGLRVESKGWGTGAYRVYRISTQPLGDPQDFEPELIHVPAGKFWASKRVRETPGHAEPSREVYLAEYWIGRYPVTVGEFAFFVKHYGHATSHEARSVSESVSWRQPNPEEEVDLNKCGRHPVVMVSKNDALAYCRWLSEVTGKTYSLLTNEQWEKAARGTDARKYPWGSSEPSRMLCNIEHWFGGTTPVGQFSPEGDGPKFDNEYGCADMIGNVSEWTLSTYSLTSKIHPDCDPDYYYLRTRTYSLTRGASWRMSPLSYSKGYRRHDHLSDHVGFRVVANPSTA